MRKLTEDQQAEIITKACRVAGLDGHITWRDGRKTNSSYTWAEKIMTGICEQKKNVPTKNSYVYCETLDVCFFFTAGMKPCFTYAGYAVHGCKDLGTRNLEAAFKKAGEVLDLMEIKALQMELDGKESEV